MTYLLVPMGSVPREQRANARGVDVCPVDGTVFDSRVTCPSCTLRLDPRWSG